MRCGSGWLFNDAALYATRSASLFCVLDPHIPNQAKEHAAVWATLRAVYAAVELGSREGEVALANVGIAAPDHGGAPAVLPAEMMRIAHSSGLLADCESAYK